jgi:hypothetical protein
MVLKTVKISAANITNPSHGFMPLQIQMLLQANSFDNRSYPSVKQTPYLSDSQHGVREILSKVRETCQHFQTATPMRT